MSNHEQPYQGAAHHTIYSAAAVANYIISHASSVTNLKLQKMLYYMQGFALARLGHVLFRDYIEAWTYGPVVPTVYDLFKENGAAPIRHTVPAEEITNPRTQQFLDGLIHTMEPYSGADLVALTHKIGTPWSQVWGKGEGRFGIIPTEMIRKYFLEILSPE